MDPVTHAVIGMMIGSKAGGAISLANGALVASTLGAVAPDLDIVARLWGDYAYIRQHRGFSHSLPGQAFVSLTLAAVLAPLYPEAGFATLALWSFLGVFSHSFADLFNSYGVNILWPFSKKKWTINLLMIFDPVLFALIVSLLFAGTDPFYNKLAVAGTVFYLALRFLMRRRAYFIVKTRLGRKYPGVRVVVLPSMRNFFKWDFVARLPQRNIVGTVSLIKRRFRIVRRLRCINEKIAQELSESVLGKVFREFTPLYHIDCEMVEDMLVGRFIDLRYFIGGKFLHNGTLVMDSEKKVKEAVFQPFHQSRRNYLKVS